MECELYQLLDCMILSYHEEDISGQESLLRCYITSKVRFVIHTYRCYRFTIKSTNQEM